MKTNFLLPLILIFLFLTSCGTLPHYRTEDGAYKLEYKLPKGFSYKSKTDIAIKSNSNMAIAFKNIDFKAWMKTKETVVDVTEKGEYKMTSQITDTSKGEKIVNFNPQNPFAMLPPVMNAIFEGFKGHKFEYTMNRKGKMIEFTFDQKIVPEMCKKMVTLLGLEGQLDPAAFQPSIEKAITEQFQGDGSTRGFYPDKPVKVGDKWNVKIDKNQNNINFSIDTVYTLKKVIDEKFAIVTFSGEAKDVKSDKISGMKLSMEMYGEFIVNMKNGVIEKTDSKAKVKVSVPLPAKQENFPSEISFEFDMSMQQALIK